MNIVFDKKNDIKKKKYILNKSIHFNYVFMNVKLLYFKLRII